MKYIFLLSKEDLKLAKEEVLSLFNIDKYKLIDNLLFLELDDIELANRLAYTKKVYQFLFESNEKDIKNKIEEFDWQSIYKKDFAVRISGKDQFNLKEKTLASHIWNKLNNPKVNLDNPKTHIEFFMIKDKIYATKLIKDPHHTFESRKAHKRPERHPTALNPKLARAIINLAGAKKSIMDPFCGAGGILIEAGLIGLKPIGYDLYKIMVEKSEKNLKHYKIKNYKLVNQDALKIKGKYDYIITDVPYGLNSAIWKKVGKENKKIPLKQDDRKKGIKNLEGFYLEFLKNLKKIMKIKAVVIFPNYVDYKKLVKKANLKIEKEFSQYIHKSLTRKILVLS